MGVSVIGCGHWGKNLVRNYAELGALVSVCDPNIELAKKFSEKYGVPSLSFEAVLGSDCQGVVIAAPAVLHATLAEQSFAAGKHVYVEKPMAMTINEADRMIAASKNACRHLMVGHLLQYHPAFVGLLEIVESGALGKLIHIHSKRLSWGKIRSGEDVVWSFAPHDISMVLSLAKDNITTVFCNGHKSIQQNVADTATLHLEFAKGLQATISCSWLHPIKEQKLVVVGNKASIVFDDTKPLEQKLAVYNANIDINQSPPMLEKAKVDYKKINAVEPLKAECQYFLDLMVGEVPAKTGGNEGREVLRVLTVASESMVKGKRLNA